MLRIMRLRRAIFPTRKRAHDLPSLVFHLRTGTVHLMNKTVIEVQVRAVLPTSGGCAVFIGNNDKVFIIYVDQTVGGAITMFMRQITKERPLTHDLIGHLMTALGAKVERVIINDLKNATYYARVIIRVENEWHQKKIIELDGRPSDCTARLTRGTKVAPALNSSIPSPSKSGMSATSPAISPQTPTQISFACAASAIILSKRITAGWVGW